jgi:hypothetical protein
MSILSALKETQHANNNLDDLAKLPQALIMQMAQNGQIPKDMVMPILGKKAEMAESTAKMNAAKQIAAQGGAQPTIMEQYMGQIAQAENPAPPMPQQQMQQPMPQQTPQQQMAQTPMPQGPEDVGIATQATAPMQMAGGGIVAFDDGGDVDIDPDDDYQDLVDQAEEDSMNEEIYGLINQMAERGGRGERGERAAVGIRSGENKNIKEDTRGRAMEDKGDLESRLRAVILQKESGGRRYDKSGNLLTSSKGAEGEMQVMPFTAMDPGFGVKPAQNKSPDELRRVGDDYASAMLKRYKDPKLAMIAYNMGPGATDKWMAAGADPSKLPKETQGYIRNVNLAQGGIIPKFSGVGPSLIDIDGNPLRSSPSVPRSTTTFYPDYLLSEEYGYPSERERLLDEEYRKGKPASSSKTSKTSRPTDKVYTSAEKAIEEQKLRRASMSQPKPKASVKSGIGSLRGATIPALAISGAGALLEGLSGPDQVNIPTEADVNPGDLTAAEIEAAKRPALIYPKIRGKRYTSDLPVVRGQEPTKQQQQPTSQKEGFVDPNIERLKQMDVYGKTKQEDAPAAPAQQKAEEETFNLMQYIREQQANRKKAAGDDKNMALLAAGLGMLGGTSQYALENIGKGGQMGVQQLANLQRLRASQDIADSKLLGTAANIQQRDKYNTAALAQNKELKQDKMAQDLITNRNSFIEKRLAKSGLTEQLISALKLKQLNKTITPEEAQKLSLYTGEMNKIESEANRLYPPQGSGSGFSARRIGQ